METTPTHKQSISKDRRPPNGHPPLPNSGSYEAATEREKRKRTGRGREKETKR